VESCREAFNAQAVGNALYGMQQMSSDSAEVRAMLSALLPKVKSCREALKAQAVGNALYGMQGMGGAAEFLALIRHFYYQVLMIAGSPSLLKSLLSKDLMFLSQNLVLTLPVLREGMKDEYERWKTINILLANELVKRKSNADPFFQPRTYRSNAERRVYDIAKIAFENSDITILSNEYLCNTFEADIVLRVPIANSAHHSPLDSEVLVVNVEVDSIHHKLERKKRFCMLRDKYLRSQGVIIERIEVSVLRRMKDMEVKEWLLKRVAISQKNRGIQTINDDVIESTCCIVIDEKINGGQDLQMLKGQTDREIKKPSDDDNNGGNNNDNYENTNVSSYNENNNHDNDKKINRSQSIKNRILNPVTRRMIKIDGDVYNKLIRLGYIHTDDGRLILSNT
jgi:hypothetical protein